MHVSLHKGYTLHGRRRRKTDITRDSLDIINKMASPDISFDSTPSQPNPGESFARSFARESEKSQLGDDGLLLAKIAQGDEAAMSVVFDRYSKVVYSVALRVLRDPSAAEDVLQEIFMQVWRKPESFLSTRGSLGGWLAVVARNRSIDLIRRRKPQDSVEDVVLASSFNLAEESERNIMMQRARGAILSIQPDQRKALEMAFFDGMTHAEIAELTGDPLGTVKTRIRTGLLALRKAMSV